MNKYLQYLSLLMIATALVGCGGSGYSNSSGSGGGGGGGGTVTVALGSGSGGSFQPGVLALSSTSLSAGGSATVTATLQNSNGTAYTQSATITFNSPCFQNGLAAFNVNGVAGNTVTTTTGLASITYVAQGCGGSDTITATTTVGTSNLSATGTLTVASPTIGSIQFVSATPTTISLKGVGGTETSTVVFKVLTSTGGPVPGATVSFSLDSKAGGLSLSPASAISGNDGSAQTVVQAGNVPTTVRVTATVTTPGGTISTQSSSLTVSTGFPTENGFSLAAVTLNPEGGDLDGTTDVITARLVDNFGNPVPDGTAVSFITTGGSITPNCTTGSGVVGTPTGPGSGACFVTWTSQNPRPNPSVKAPAVLYHAEILAFALGEESWTDANSNGIFDAGDTFTLYPGAPAAGDNFYPGGAPANKFGPQFDDIGELYIDQGETGAYAPGDYFVDFNKTGVRDGPDGMYHGAGCLGTATVACSPSTSIYVGLQFCLVMSTSEVIITGPTHVAAGSSPTFFASDLNGNVPPKGTAYAIVPGSSVVPTIVNPTEANISCAGSTPPTASYAIGLIVPSGVSGSFVISATSPSGLVSFSNSISVP